MAHATDIVVEAVATMAFGVARDGNGVAGSLFERRVRKTAPVLLKSLAPAGVDLFLRALAAAAATHFTAYLAGVQGAAARVDGLDGAYVADRLREARLAATQALGQGGVPTLDDVLHVAEGDPDWVAAMTDVAVAAAE